MVSPRLVAVAKALELLWTGDVIDATEALRLGIVNRVALADDLERVTVALARRLADGPSVAIRLTKRAVYQSMRADLRTSLDQMSSHMAIAFQTADHREGILAFRERREPRFVGR